MPLAATDKVDLIFRAFSDRTRLRILNLLTTREEICVCDLMQCLSCRRRRFPTLGLSAKGAELVAGRKELQWMHYRLLPPTRQFHAKILECLNCCLAEVPELMGDRERLRSCCSNGPPCCD